ncbi:MAG: VWA domain-containing protein, partial [Bryobacteraceae bacterium]
MRRALALCLLLPLLLAVPAQAQDRGQDQEKPTIRVDVNFVQLEATVKNKAGQIMEGLKKEDFIVREDGVPQKIAQFSNDQLPLSVVLVLDLSDSIGPFLNALREAARVALQSLKPEDEVALFTFSTQLSERIGFTKDRQSVEDQFSRLQIGGSTNINGAIYGAAEYLFRQAPRTRRVIILISDNVATDNGGVRPKD